MTKNDSLYQWWIQVFTLVFTLVPELMLLLSRLMVKRQLETVSLQSAMLLSICRLFRRTFSEIHCDFRVFTKQDNSYF